MRGARHLPVRPTKTSNLLAGAYIDGDRGALGDRRIERNAAARSVDVWAAFANTGQNAASTNNTG